MNAPRTRLWNLVLSFPLALLALLAPLQSAADDAVAPVIGRQVEEFTLKDYRGAEHKLADQQGKRLVVLAVLGTECPLVKLYGNRLAELAEEYEPQGVAFIGLNANVQDSNTEVAAFARRHEIEFPVLKDLGNKVCDQIGAVRTPEVYVLDQKRVIRYAGRIDDQYGVGYLREKVEHAWLKDALDELLADKPVTTASVESVGCYIGRVREPKPDAKVTYSNQIARVFQKHCVECHREGEIAPFALTSYDEVVGWAETIREVIKDERMPPWHAVAGHGHFDNERRMSDEEKQLVYQWIKDGAPQGDPQDLPEPRTFTSGWQLPKEPDVVVPIRSSPVKVQAEGEVKYQYFMVDSGFTEDKWVKAAELQPSNRAVVHHILVFARTPGGRLSEGTKGYLVGYVPGLRQRPYPPGYAKRIPAGSQFVFQVHYTPIGSEQEDLSRLGLVFADPKEVTHEVKTTSAAQRFLRIPPGDDNYRATASATIRNENAEVLGYMPHMHVRGKAFRYEIEYPDGKEDILLDVPKYDFNWQTAYRLAEPLKLPVGTEIHCTAYFDNSEGNLNNPDPTATVRWGDQTWEEMMIGYFDVALPVDPSQPRKDDEGDDEDGGPLAADRAEQYIKQLDKDGDNKISEEEMPPRLKRAFSRIDKNGDGGIDADELAKSLGQLLGGGR